MSDRPGTRRTRVRICSISSPSRDRPDVAVLEVPELDRRPTVTTWLRPSARACSIAACELQVGEHDRDVDSFAQERRQVDRRRA